VAIYMKYGSIEGDATQSDYEHWINIDSLKWDVTWNIQTRTNKNATRTGAHPSIGDVTVTKLTDRATAGLLQAITNPEKPNGEDCIIRFLLTTTLTKDSHDPDWQTFLEYILYNTLITELNTSCDANNSRPVETVKLNFTGVEVNIWPLDRDNMRFIPHRFGRYDKIQDK
jgi:type VI protein secretion system component Hcp